MITDSNSLKLISTNKIYQLDLSNVNAFSSVGEFLLNSLYNSLYDNQRVISREYDISFKDNFSVYSSENWHNNLIMAESTYTPQKRIIENQYRALVTILSEIDIDYDEELHYFDYLDQLRLNNDYKDFIQYVKCEWNAKICKAICVYLSQKKYEFVKSYEENFVLSILQRGTTNMQAIALETILTWGHISNFDQLNNVQIANRYLQKDLNNFICCKRS